MQFPRVHVLPEGRHGTVPGLVGYGPVAGAPQMGVGDKAGPKRMGRVGERVKTAPLDGGRGQGN